MFIGTKRVKDIWTMEFLFLDLSFFAPGWRFKFDENFLSNM